MPEFEALAGIEVTLEIFPEDQLRQVRLLEVSSGAATLDGYMVMPGQVGDQYLGAGWLRYIDDLVANPSLTMPDLDLDDSFGGAIGTFLAGGRLFGLPQFSVCGRCEHCRTGRPNLCARRRSIGSFEDGGFPGKVLLLP